MNIKKGIAFVVTGGIFWGASGTVAQYIFSQYNISPIWLVGIRLLMAGILLLLWYWLATKKSIFKIWHYRKSLISLLLFSFLGMLPSQLTYFMAIKYGNAPTATVLQFLGPIFIIIYLALASHTLPQKIDIISIVIALLGTFLLVTSGHLKGLSLSPLALLWGLGAGLSQASYTLLPRHLLKEFDARLIVGWAMTLSGLPFIVTIVRQPMRAVPLELVGDIGFIVIFGTMLAYLFYINSLNYISPATTGMLSSFEPLTSTILAVTFLHTQFSMVQVIGGILVISTVFLQALPKKYSV